MYSLFLLCLQVIFKEKNNPANVESYPSLHYYTVCKGVLFAFTKTTDHRVSQGRRHTSHGRCLWGMMALDWLLSIPWCFPEGKRINLCTIMVGGPCSAGHYPSNWPWLPWCCETGWYFKSHLCRPNNPIYCKALINRRSVIKHLKKGRKRQMGNTNTISMQWSEI